MELKTDRMAAKERHDSRVHLIARHCQLAARGMLVVSVARRFGSEGPLLAYCAAPL